MLKGTNPSTTIRDLCVTEADAKSIKIARNCSVVLSKALHFCYSKTYTEFPKHFFSFYWRWTPKLHIADDIKLLVLLLYITFVPSYRYFSYILPTLKIGMPWMVTLCVCTCAHTNIRLASVNTK